MFSDGFQCGVAYSLNFIRLVGHYALYPGNVSESHLKNTSNAQLRCCEPLQNAHILHVCSAFSSARALSLNVICIFEMACIIPLKIHQFYININLPSITIYRIMRFKAAGLI